MQIAARWVGCCGLMLGAAVAIAALYARHDATTSLPESESWRELTYRTFVMGADCWSTPEASAHGRIANEEALADCMDNWEGNFAVHQYPGEPDSLRMILVDEASPLGKCLRVRDWHDVPFCYSSWARPPADAQWNAPLHLGNARPRVADVFRREREREAAALAVGEIVATSCPTQAEPTFVGLPSNALQATLRRCNSNPKKSTRVVLDEIGTVVRVIATPEQQLDVPCVIANACGLRFAGLGTGVWY